MSAPLINNNNKQTAVNAALWLQMTHQLRKNLRGRTKQVRVQLQNHQPLLNPLLKPRRQLQVPVVSSSDERTGNTGPRSVPDLVATTGFKIGTISACLSSTQPASANNWAGSLPISLPSSKSTSFSGFILRNRETGALHYHHPSANNLVWSSRFWPPIKTIQNTCMTKSITPISWSGFASKGPAVNGWWIWLQTSSGLCRRSGIILSAKEHFFLYI